MAPRTLFVSNFPFATTEPELRSLFQAHCPIRSIRIITDRDSGRSRGFAFIEVEGERDASVAIEALNETMLGGRRLVVSHARGRSIGGEEKAPNASASSTATEPFRHRIVVEWSDADREYTADVPDLGVTARAETIADAVRRVQSLARARSTAAGGG